MLLGNEAKAENNWAVDGKGYGITRVEVWPIFVSDPPIHEGERVFATMQSLNDDIVFCNYIYKDIPEEGDWYYHVWKERDAENFPDHVMVIRRRGEQETVLKNKLGEKGLKIYRKLKNMLMPPADVPWETKNVSSFDKFTEWREKQPAGWEKQYLSA